MMNRKTIYLDEPIVRINKKLDEVYSHPKTEYATGYADACIAVIKMLNSLEEARPQRWIPVTEKPPKEDVEVLVYLFDPPSPYIAWVSKFDGKWRTEDFTLDEEDIPIAYMPMPEPYKER